MGKYATKPDGGVGFVRGYIGGYDEWVGNKLWLRQRLHSWSEVELLIGLVNAGMNERDIDIVRVGDHRNGEGLFYNGLSHLRDPLILTIWIGYTPEEVGHERDFVLDLERPWDKVEAFRGRGSVVWRQAYQTVNIECDGPTHKQGRQRVVDARFDDFAHREVFRVELPDRVFPGDVGFSEWMQTQAQRALAFLRDSLPKTKPGEPIGAVCTLTGFDESGLRVEMPDGSILKMKPVK